MHIALGSSSPYNGGSNYPDTQAQSKGMDPYQLYEVCSSFCRAVRRRWDEIYELKAARSYLGGSRASGLPPTPFKNSSLQMGRNPINS